MPSKDVLIAPIARRQHGVFTYAQALSCGFSPETIRHRVRSGRWLRVHRGVYEIAGIRRTFENRTMAAVLRCGPSALASHRTAAALFQLEGIDRTLVEITVPARHRVRVDGISVRQSTTLRSSDHATIADVPVTAPERTMIDLASVLERDRLEDALDDAIRRKYVHPRSLEERLRRMDRRGSTGTGVLLELVSTRTTRSVAGSGRENRIRRALRRAGLPEPVRQLAIYDPAGLFVARVDLAYPDDRLYIEYDGGHHESPRQRQADLVRQNRLSEMGWRPLRVTKEILRAGDAAVTAGVRMALRRSPDTLRE